MRRELYMVLVCGGRDYCDRARLYAVMDAYRFLYGKLMVLHGAARGADTLAEEWAKSREQVYVGMPAEWTEYRKQAGTKRNGEMLEYGNPSLVIAFRGGHGTFNMAERSEEAGVLVHRWDWET